LRENWKESALRDAMWSFMYVRAEARTLQGKKDVQQGLKGKRPIFTVSTGDFI
jgi:hypothetical protein